VVVGVGLCSGWAVLFCSGLECGLIAGRYWVSGNALIGIYPSRVG